jgi:hypothetical protein
MCQESAVRLGAGVLEEMSARGEEIFRCGDRRWDVEVAG